MPDQSLPPTREPDLPQPNGASAGRAFGERLWPSAGIWAVVAGLGLAAALITLPLGPEVMLAAALITVGLLSWALIATTPEVRVSPTELVAGRARIERSFLGDVTVLDAAALRQQIGPGADARAYLCHRGWIPTGVRVEVLDPADPAPYWVISCRRPEKLAAALQNG